MPVAVLISQSVTTDVSEMNGGREAWLACANDPASWCKHKKETHGPRAGRFVTEKLKGGVQVRAVSAASKY